MPLTTLTHATGIGPLPDVLETLAGHRAVRRVFACAQVPSALLRDRRQRLPIALLAGLYREGAEVTGDALFGLAVGTAMRPSEYGLWAQYAAQAPTLAAAVARAARTLHVHQNGSYMRLAPRSAGNIAWEYRHPEIKSPLFRQHSEHILAVMINFIRHFLGPGWHPAAVEMCYAAPDRVVERESATASAWVFDRDCVALVLPASALAASGPASTAQSGTARRISYTDVLTQSPSPWTDDLLDQTAAIITLRLLEGTTDIDGTARMLGISCRTLQRCLKDQGLNYRSLVTRIRMQRARSIVEETDVPLKRIGYELGYRDPADFTRAFRSYFGYPPSRLRPRAPDQPG